ncbi:hypothetical protein H6P81_014152 [Aristolochia fimbriata]|uniref:beta-carotene 3-hydroxylase n=1 Tax=Aristolochia fimbriata TaxID=158543 RepID=A0AAV7EH67_ARIFI|nr:hypothetical protein H6P81_014152 [Aristolochia fimbriata]
MIKVVLIPPPTVHLLFPPLSSTSGRRPRPVIGGGRVLTHGQLHRQLPAKLPRCLIGAQASDPAPLDNSTATEGSDTTTEPTTTKPVAKARDRKGEREAYLFAALASSVGITSMAAGAVYYRFAWQTQGGEIPWEEMLGTFSLALGATVGMEHWARWAHRTLWHSSLWFMHESHHRPREGPFETNDVFAIINCIPAISLMAYGFFNRGLLSGLSFGAGLGITVYGMAYMFVHDGLVHKRFPVGPIADVPYLKKVAAAHQLHHADKFNGVPFGLFLGPKELEDVGGLHELEKLMKAGTRKRNEEVGTPSKG